VEYLPANYFPYLKIIPLCIINTFIVRVLFSPSKLTLIMNKYAEPTFIVGGGVRCATGWIRECLSEHPQIYVQPKEIHFFDQNYEKGKEWYFQFFSESGNRKIIGEKTASYLHNDVASRIKETVPDVKLVFCLRDPIDRMYSHYTMLAASDSALREKGFVKSIDIEPKILEWSKYSEQINKYIKLFPSENLLIKIYEDIEKKPYEFLSDIFNFIGADASFQAPSSKLRTKLGQFEHNSPLWGLLSKGMLHKRAPKFLRSVYTEIRPEKNDILSDEIYEQFSTYYHDDINRLEKMLNRDLSLWPTKRNTPN
jgi:hypothetical protein